MVVAQRAHRDSHLREVVQVLQRRRLSQIKTMVNPMSKEEGYSQMFNVPCLASVRPIFEAVEASLLAQPAKKKGCQELQTREKLTLSGKEQSSG